MKNLEVYVAVVSNGYAHKAFMHTQGTFMVGNIKELCAVSTADDRKGFVEDLVSTDTIYCQDEYIDLFRVINPGAFIHGYNKLTCGHRSKMQQLIEYAEEHKDIPNLDAIDKSIVECPRKNRGLLDGTCIQLS